MTGYVIFPKGSKTPKWSKVVLFTSAEEAEVCRYSFTHPDDFEVVSVEVNIPKTPIVERKAKRGHKHR